jgi:N-acetylmuramoyl-L-alanine amidase
MFGETTDNEAKVFKQAKAKGTFCILIAFKKTKVNIQDVIKLSNCFFIILEKKHKFESNHGIQKIILSLFLFLGIFPFLNQSKFTVILDAGHGGKIQGIRIMVLLKRVALKTTLKLENILKRS